MKDPLFAYIKIVCGLGSEVVRRAILFINMREEKNSDDVLGYNPPRLPGYINQNA
jgi:hypothetical protein